MATLLSISPFIAALILGLALGVAAMLRGIDRHLARRTGRVSPLNMPTVAAFFSVMGAVGYPLARYTALSPIGTWLIAIAGGLAAGAGVYALLAGYIVPASANDVEDERYRLQGHIAVVTREIQPTADGEIAFEENGERVVLPARGLAAEHIATGAEVAIERVEDGIAHVELWSRIAEELQLPA